MSGPSQVMIIRHGEKLGDPATDGDSTGKQLSVQGSARATFLPSLFLPAPPPSQECKLEAAGAGFTATYEAKQTDSSAPRFPMPQFLFATQASHHSNRPIDTITPTSAALGLTLNTKYSDSTIDIDALATDVLTNSAYADAIVLICWHHGTIDALATALGGTGAQKWHGSVFDRVWLLNYAHGPSPAIQQFGQELLFTNETNVPSTPW